VKTISVLVCETQPIVVEGLKRLLEGCEDVVLAGETTRVEEIPERVAALRPDVLLVDNAFGSRLILELIPRVRASSEATQTVLWVTGLSETESFRALQAGARGILKKTLPVTSVLDCLRAVGQGNIWIENSISNQVVGFLNRTEAPRLTPRERQIAELACRGLKNKEIAERLLITIGTVKVHLMHIFEKAGVHDRFELALQARTRLNLSLDDEGPETTPGESESSRASRFGWSGGGNPE
jgi:DNA-binding NarL/FixJ family response regulator